MCVVMMNAKAAPPSACSSSISAICTIHHQPAHACTGNPFHPSCLGPSPTVHLLIWPHRNSIPLTRAADQMLTCRLWGLICSGYSVQVPSLLIVLHDTKAADGMQCHSWTFFQSSTSEGVCSCSAPISSISETAQVACPHLLACMRCVISHRLQIMSSTLVDGSVRQPLTAGLQQSNKLFHCRNAI